MKSLDEASAEVWETLCVMELKKRRHSEHYINKSKEAGFEQVNRTPETSLTKLIIYKNLYWPEVLLSINIKDVERAPYWIVRYLQGLGFECNLPDKN